jgi:hypothetical protein
MSSVRFSDIKDHLIKPLEEQINNLGSVEKFTLIDGFFNRLIENEIDGKIVLKGQTVPMVAVVGNQSGRVHFFAVKILLPNLEI